MNTVSIYKVCAPSGKCLYVGKAHNPKNRAREHQQRFKNATFSIIKQVPLKDASKAERTAILQFKKIGEAVFNQVIPSTFIDKIKRLKVGKSCRVKTDSERKEALKIAGILGVTLTSRASKRGGFTVTRLPE